MNKPKENLLFATKVHATDTYYFFADHTYQCLHWLEGDNDGRSRCGPNLFFKWRLTQNCKVEFNADQDQGWNTFKGIDGKELEADFEMWKILNE